MAANAIVYDDQGRQIFRASDYIGRVLGVFYTSNVDGSLAVDLSFVGNGRPWVSAMPSDVNANESYRPRVYFSGNVIYWVYPPTTVQNPPRAIAKVTYGVY